MQSPSESKILLGIEAGGTRTVALQTTWDGVVLQRAEFGPGNLRLLSDADLARLFRAVRAFCPRPAAVGLGMAGLRDQSDARRVESALERCWPKTPFGLAHDLETGLRASSSPTQMPQVIVVSGTGSCCYGRSTDGRASKLGGWGHILGDKGSGYEIGLRALKAVVYYFDRDGKWSALGESILRELLLNRPDDLIPWVQAATKNQIAALAILVFEQAVKRDKIARDILEGAGATLAKDAVACLARLAQESEPAQAVLSGSVLTKQPAFTRKVARLIQERRPGTKVVVAQREGAWGAIALAREAVAHFQEPLIRENISPPRGPVPPEPPLSLTEERNPRSMNLDRLSVEEGIDLFLAEENTLPAAIAAEKKEIARVIRLTTAALKRGGRLFYFGAGSSGRLGVLDASECPPTFRAHPEQVQGVIAGGYEALWKAKEGAEDDAGAGAEAARFRGVRRGDVVIGITASGGAPFVWGALTQARKRGAKTVLLCFNPRLQRTRAQKVDVLMAPAVGPEILTGSTRLKAATATKVILNMITTLSMVGFGKVASNLMVDLKPSNEKLRNRAVRILQQLSNSDPETARDALEKNGWVIKKALEKLK